MRFPAFRELIHEVQNVLNGQIAKFVSRWVETRTNFLVAAAILLLAGGLILIVSKYRPSDATSVAGATGSKRLERVRGGVEALKGSRQLRLIAAIMVLTVVVAQIVDVQPQEPLGDAGAPHGDDVKHGPRQGQPEMPVG